MSPPILLVHGLLTERWFLLPLQHRLRHAGFDPHLTRLPPLCVQDVRVLAAAVAAQARRLADARGAPIGVVGVSQGGVASMWAVQQLGASDAVDRLVTLGTPFAGAPLARLGAAVIGWASEGVRQLVPGHPLLDTLIAGGVPDGVRMTTIGVATDLVAPPDRCAFPGARHVVVRGGPSPLAHQWMALSRASIAAISEGLAPVRER